MNKKLFSVIAFSSEIFSLTSCTKKDSAGEPAVKAYTVPTTYSFANAEYSAAASLVKMTVETDSYLKTANAGSSVVSLDQTVVNNMFANTGSPFSDATLNNSGINITNNTTDASLYKSYADSVLIFNTGATASKGVGGFLARSSNKIVVGPKGLEYGQAFTKGTMSSMLFVKAVKALNEVKQMTNVDTITAQKLWDEAFGYLSVPVDYDPTKTYTSADANRPLLWGGYLAERGKDIDAGAALFNAFLKGRAAIGGYDKTVRNEQADIIIAKWEQLAAAAALAYVTSPTTAAGNLGSQFHGLSEGFGFLHALKNRPSTSKLTAADFDKLNEILHKDFYDLVDQTGFADLVAAQNILKNAYGL